VLIAADLRAVSSEMTMALNGSPESAVTVSSSHGPLSGRAIRFDQKLCILGFRPSFSACANAAQK
jgi:hypothetical protein